VTNRNIVARFDVAASLGEIESEDELGFGLANLLARDTDHRAAFPTDQWGQYWRMNSDPNAIRRDP
jgi:hypothetical protein